MKTVRVIIVDDEPLARDALRVELNSFPEANIVAEYADGRNAVEGILRHEPDLVFLDIQMPEMDGLEVVRAVGIERMPPVVFVTAFDHYALEAFEVHAVDYLLKPFDGRRFAEAYRVAVRRMKDTQAGELNQRLLELLGEHLVPGGEAESQQAALEPSLPISERLEIKLAGRSYLLDVDEIEWIEAANSYVRIHAGGRTHLLRSTISGMERKLDSNRFVRIHRSSIVNIACVSEFEPIDHGDYEVVLKDGQRLRASRSHRDALLARLRR